MKRTLTRIIMAVFAVAMLASMTGCYSTPEGGETIVVRNGGPFDDRQIRQIVPNGAGNTWVGWASESRAYPASDQQRIYKFDTGNDADAKPVTVPTKDGVQVRLTGTFYINTAFDGTKEGDKLLTKFDTQFGNRKFGGEKVYDEDGWAKFLNTVVQPVIDSNIREVIAEFECKELVSSCALVQRGTNGQINASEVAKGGTKQSNVTRIQDRINTNLAEEITAKLGAPYFRNIKFSLGPVELPGVQEAINEAQSAFAEVSKSQAKVEQAKADRRANEEKEKGYNVCSSCARQDEFRALPENLQVLGGNPATVLGR